MNDLFDVSLVLALHREGALLRPTLLSLREAARHARAEGITVELVATLDRPDEATRQALGGLGTEGFDGWTTLEVDNGSLGLTRNSGIGRARGRYVAVCDGDDLISFNSITVMFRLAENMGTGCIIFPEYLYAFGYRYHCWKYFPPEVVTPLSFIDTHPYVSRVFAHRSVFQAVPYVDAGISSGYAYEDWHFNAECVAHGYRILVAENTILFYRQRKSSLAHQADISSSGQIRPSSLFKPETWVTITRDAYERLTPLGGRRPESPDGISWGAVLDSAEHRTFVGAANALDPTVHFRSLKTSTFSSNLSGRDLMAGLAYHEVCRIVGAQRFDEVFLLPFIAKDGADRYVGDAMQALYEMRPTARILVVLGEPLFEGSRPDRVPPNATVLDLGTDWPRLTMDQRQLVTLKLIQSAAPLARLHLRPSRFADGFYDRFKTILRSNPTILYRFLGMIEPISGGTLVEGQPFNFVAEHISDLSLIVTDDQTIIERDRERVGIYAEKWRYLPARQVTKLTPATIAERTTMRHGRILCIWRFDQQKRPELLLQIATRLRNLGSNIGIDVFGNPVLDTFNADDFAGLQNLCYRGPFDDLASIDCERYDAFVYTSRSDDSPNVVLAAVAAGLPVIAADIGGIAEFIVDGESGLLLAPLPGNEAMAEAYAHAIARLVDDAELRGRLVTGAHRLLAQRHAPAAFRVTAREIFGDRRTETGSRHPQLPAIRFSPSGPAAAGSTNSYRETVCVR
jgi:glycosyltransferase involved in cell wall biosynthesis